MAMEVCSSSLIHPMVFRRGDTRMVQYDQMWLARMSVVMEALTNISLQSKRSIKMHSKIKKKYKDVLSVQM